VNCAECKLLMHALLDGELDAGHAREVERHLETCSSCAAQFQSYRRMQEAMSTAQLRFDAPAALRRRIEAEIPGRASTPRAVNRRSMLQGFAMGSVLSGAIAASLVLGIFANNPDDRLLGDMLSAHLRSLQGEHLTDVQSGDGHTVKPWFNGRVDVSPPVVDLAGEGFPLIGGRLDYVDGRAVACIVYRRRMHVINVFVLRREGSEYRVPKLEAMQGFNIRHWTLQGLDFFAVSDLNAEELVQFVQKFETAARPAGT
jgi:anti-sigma factor RsiW